MIHSHANQSHAKKRSHFLIKAKVAHHRLTPKKNGFVYRQDYAFLETSSEIENKENTGAHSKTPKLFSINKWNLFSYWFIRHAGARLPSKSILSLALDWNEDPLSGWHSAPSYGAEYI